MEPGTKVKPMFGPNSGFGTTFAFVPDSVANRSGASQRVSNGEYVKAMFDAHMLMGSIAENAAFYSAVALGSEPDSNYSPMDDLSIPADDRRHFLESRSAAETEMIREKLRREREARNIIAAEGLTGRSVGLTMVAALPDMLAFGLGGRYVGNAGKFILGQGETAKGASLAAKIATGAASNVAQEVLAEAVKQSTQYERGWDESAWNLVGAGLVGGALPAAGGAWRALMNKNRAANLARQIEPGIIEATTEATSTGSREAMEAMYDPDIAVAGNPWKIEKPTGTFGPDWAGGVPLIRGLTPNQRRFRWMSPKVGEVMGRLLTYGKMTDAGVYDDVVENRINGIWLSMQRKSEVDVRRVYESYVKNSKTSGVNALRYPDFQEQVGRYIQFGADENILRANGIEPDVDILAAAKRGAQFFKDAETRIKESGIADALETPAGAYGYFPRIPHAQKLKQQPTQFIDAITPYMKLEPWEVAKAEAMGIGTESIKRQKAQQIRLLYLGIDGDNIGAGGRALKTRTLTDIPDDVLRPFLVTRFDEASRIYTQKTGRRVELARQAPLTNRVLAQIKKIDELEARLNQGSMTKAEALDHAKNLELEARAITEQFTGNDAYGGPENVRKRLDEYIRAEADKRQESIRTKYEQERKAVDLSFSRKYDEIKGDAATDAELARFDFDAQRIATKQETADRILELTDEWQRQVDDIRVRQEGEIFQEQLAARRELSETIERMESYNDTIQSMHGNINKLDIGEKMEVRQFMDQLSMIDDDLIDPEASASSLHNIISDYRSDRNLSRNVRDALRSLRDSEASGVSKLRESVKAVDLKAKLLKSVSDLEGNLQNNDLIVAFFKAKGEYLGASNEIRSSARFDMDRIASIRDLRIEEIRKAKDESLSSLRESLRIFKDANKKLLRDDIKNLREQVKQVRESVSNALGERAAAFRLAAAKDKLSALKRIEGESMLNPETWANMVGPDYKMRISEVDEQHRAGLLSAADADARKRALESDYTKAKEEIRNSVKLITGAFGHDKDVSGISRMADWLRALSYVTKMGKMMLTNAADVPQPILRVGWSHGIKGYKAYLKTIRSTGETRQVRDAFRAFAGGLEAFNSERMMALIDHGYTEMERTAGEMAIESMVRKMGKFTGFNYLNDATKSGAALGYSDFIHRVAPLMADGKASRVEAGLMRLWGIDTGMAKELADPNIWQDFAGSVKVPNFNMLSKETAERLGMALNTAVDTSVTTPRLGQIALLQRTWWGKLLFQFKSFMVAHHETTASFIEAKISAGTPMEKASAGAAVAATMGVAALSVYMKAWSAGDEDRYLNDPSAWFADSLDQSAVMGLFMEANNYLEALTAAPAAGKYRLGFRPNIAGVESGSFRYRGADPVAYIAGPSGDIVKAMVDGLGGMYGLATEGTMSAHQAKQIAKLVPYNNVFWLTTMPYELADFAGNLSGLYDLPETREEIAVSLGAKPSGKRGKKPRL